MHTACMTMMHALSSTSLFGVHEWCKMAMLLQRPDPTDCKNKAETPSSHSSFASCLEDAFGGVNTLKNIASLEPLLEQAELLHSFGHCPNCNSCYCLVMLSAHFLHSV